MRLLEVVIVTKSEVYSGEEAEILYIFQSMRQFCTAKYEMIQNASIVPEINNTDYLYTYIYVYIFVYIQYNNFIAFLAM